MSRLFALCATLGLLSACSDEPEIVVVEPIEDEEVSYGESEAAPLAWDADGDGMLNQEEYLGLSNAAWGVWDTDRTGSLSQAEFAAGWSEAGFADAAGAFGTMDRDGDGSIVQADFLGAQQWEDWDANDSGMLEAEEFPYY